MKVTFTTFSELWKRSILLEPQKIKESTPKSKTDMKNIENAASHNKLVARGKSLLELWVTTFLPD